jgi:hypothetical protein
MEEKISDQQKTTTGTEPKCTCTILCDPPAATTSMWNCVAHGEPDDLSPLPGQSLKYCVLVSQGDEMAEGAHTLIGPLTTADGIETAKFYARHLEFKVHGVLPLMALADLDQLATSKGAGEGPPPGMSKLPASLKPTVNHEPGCAWSDQEHPGKCYVRQETAIGHVPAGNDRFA